MGRDKEINYGICLLRIILVFLVVCFHFHANWDHYPGPYIFLREMTVPVFLLVAFYLGEPTITGDDGEKKKSRMVRLFLPYIFWGVGAWVFVYVMEHILAIKDGVTLSELLWQIAFGCVEKVDPPLYFLWQVMLYTLCFFVLFSVLKKRTASVILILLSLLCLWVQYDGRATLFFKTFRYEIMYGVGRIYELLPFAIFGTVIAVFKVDKLLKSKRGIFLVILSILVPLMIFFRDQIFIRPEETLAYSGVSLFVVSPLLFLWFLILPFEKLPGSIKRVIHTMSEYTLGVFAIHWPLGRFINMAYKELTGSERSLTLCVIIYLICWILAYIIGRLPGRLSSMLVK